MIFFSLEKNRFLFFEKEKKKKIIRLCVFWGMFYFVIYKKKSSSFLSRHIKITCVCVSRQIFLLFYNVHVKTYKNNISVCLFLKNNNNNIGCLILSKINYKYNVSNTIVIF